MALDNTCDVSVVFSHSIENDNKRFVNQYLNNIKNSKFISLRAVKDTFQSTFSGKIKAICDSIVIAVNKTCEKKQKRSDKLPPISTKLLDITFTKYYQTALKDMPNLDSDNNIEEYEKLLKSKVNIQFNELKDLDKLEKFGEDSLKIADIISVEAWDKFRKRLNHFKEAPRFTASKLVRWENEIREAKSKFDIFNDVDNEDIFVATEYLTYIDERNSNTLFSCLDKDLTSSLNLFKSKLVLKYPDAVYLRK